MTETVTVLHLVAGTVVEDTFTAERITIQHFRDTGWRAPALVNLWRVGIRAEQVFYADAPRIHRIVNPRKDTP